MLYSSGIGTYVYYVLLGLLESMPEVSFEILLSKENINSERGAKLLNFSNTEVTEITADIYTISEQIEIYKKINNTNLYWTPHYNVPLFLKNKVKRLVTIHDVYHLAYIDELSIAKKIYAKILMKKAVMSNKIVTVSKFSKDEIIKYTGCKSDKIEVIYNGINTNNSTINNETEHELILKNPLLNEQYIIFVGNVKPHKNLKLLVEAFAQLKKNQSNTDLKLVIVGKKEGFITGDADLFQKIDKIPQLKNEVFFTGWIEDNVLKLYYKYAKLLVFPSYYEGFGLPPLEAMSIQCPVVSSNAACMEEINENAALYFDPYSVTQLLEALNALLVDDGLANQFVEEGNKRIQFFTWKKSIKAHEKLITSMLN